MHIKLLIDEIVRQTTVLIAQLSTAAGVRAPLSHLADQVFVELAKELEAQGVRRTVVADMFGLALRSYQIKCQRLAETPQPQTSLWQAVHTLLGAGTRSKAEILAKLPTEEGTDVTTVLNDLVGSGLAYVSGRGASAMYGLTSDADRQRLSELDEQQALEHLLWQMVATGRANTAAAIQSQVSAQFELVERALQTLLADGRVVEHAGKLSAETLNIPVGAEQGWEAAVSDHFRAVATAIAAKLRYGRSDQRDLIGGGTYTFTVHPAHPEWERVTQWLQRVRTEMEEMWGLVSQHNQVQPPPDSASKVTIYFGQNVTPAAVAVSEE